MKRMLFAIAVVMVVGMIVETALADNGAPSGPHFNLNIIGVQKAKNPDFDANCGNGHRIFVPLGDEDKKNSIKNLPVDIKLTSCEAEGFGEGCDDFGVIDCDATDGEAKFMLPNPAPEVESNCTRYSVYLRVLGKPGKTGSLKTCATLDGEEVCATGVDIVLLERKGKIAPKFSNVSRQLLTLCVDFGEWVDDGAGGLVWVEAWERVYLFDSRLENWLWRYDSDGIKLVQVRFYMEETCYSEADWSCPPAPAP